MSMDHDDYATFARIEDHLRRIADALERPRTDRLSELLDIAQRGLDRVAASFRLDRSPDDSRRAMQDLAMELRAALDAKPCDDRTCTDRDHWAPTGRIDHGSTPTTCVHGQDHSDSLTCEYRCPATMPGHWCTRREHADDRHVWAMSGEEAERILRAGQELGFVAEADPLDEDDHRPRHNRYGGPGTAKTAPLSASEPFGALPDLPDAERVCEVRR